MNGEDVKKLIQHDDLPTENPRLHATDRQAGLFALFVPRSGQPAQEHIRNAVCNMLELPIL